MVVLFTWLRLRGGRAFRSRKVPSGRPKPQARSETTGSKGGREAQGTPSKLRAKQIVVVGVLSSKRQASSTLR